MLVKLVEFRVLCPALIAEQGAKLDRDLVNAQKSIEKARAMEAEYKTPLQQQKAKKALARVINDPGVRRT